MTEETQDKPVEAKGFDKRGGLIALAIVALVAVAVLAAPRIIAAADPCSAEKIAPIRAQMATITQHFDDADNLANNTARMNLPTVISELQAVRRDAQDVAVPECLRDMKTAMIDYMDAKTQGYILFMDPKNSDTIVQRQFGIASSKFQAYTSAADAFNAKHPPQ